MKRSTIWSAVGLALGLSWTSVAMADGTPLSQKRLEGRVVSVDRQQRSFQIGVNDGGQTKPGGRGTATAETKTLIVAPNAHITRDGVNVPFDELKPGDQVRASFLSSDIARTHPTEIEARSPANREAPWGVTHGD
jgi:exosome complex RNA-binding protein Csl4